MPASPGPLGLKGDLVHDAIVAECASGHQPRELLRRVSGRLRPLIPYAAAGWLQTDPATLLFTDVVAEGVDGGDHLRLFENELTAPDFAKFAAILRGPRPAATLSEATGGDPTLSARHREIHRPLGLRGELRAVFATGGSCWGAVCLSRDESEPDFSVAESAFVASLCEHVAGGLRTGMLLNAAQSTPLTEAPGMIVLGPGGEVESISDGARHWLGQLPDDGLEIPGAVHAVAMRAAAAAGGAAQEVPRARLRTRGGGWLLIHGACLRAADGDASRIAVVVEPARRAEVASIVVELYELSEREQQITQLLVRGLPIDEIATSLWLSRHTVRDHTKSIFAKVGVSSRPELTARLFAEQFLPEIEAANAPGADATGS